MSEKRVLFSEYMATQDGRQPMLLDMMMFFEKSPSSKTYWKKEASHSQLRLGGIDNIAAIYFPDDMTKMALHQKYATSCSSQQLWALWLMAFKGVWHTWLPHITIASPWDVCATCEKMCPAIMEAVLEEEKLAAVDTLKQHILHAQAIIFLIV